MYVHDCMSTGVPPVQPAGDDDVTVRVCVPSGWHAPHVEYVNDVQVGGGGGGGGAVAVEVAVAVDVDVVVVVGAGAASVAAPAS